MLDAIFFFFFVGTNLLDEISMPWSLQSPYLEAAAFLLLSLTLPIMEEGNNLKPSGILG